MKKSFWIISAAVVLIAAAMLLQGCGVENTVTYTAADNVTLSVTDSAGNEVASGAKVKYNTALTVKVTPAEGHTATLKVNGTAKTLTDNGATVNIMGDTTIDAGQTLNEHTVTIAAENGAAVTVKRGSTELSSGAKVPYGETLTVMVTNVAGYTPSLKINDIETELSDGEAEYVVKGDVTVRADQTMRFNVKSYARTGSVAFDGAHKFAGSFEGAEGGTDIDNNILFNYDLSALTAGEKYTRVFKAEQLSGETGKMQLLAYDGDYTAASGTGTAGVYWDVIKNIDALSDENIGASAEMKAFCTGGDYSGYWGSVTGNVYNAGTSSTEGGFMFLAANPGEYLLTADIIKLGAQGNTKISGYSVLVEVVTADSQKMVTAGALKNIAAAKWNYTGSYLGEKSGADISENIEFRYDVTRSDTEDMQFLPVFRVESLAGGDARKTQMLVYDMDTQDGQNGIYYDVLSNFGAIAEIGTVSENSGADLTLNRALAAKTGYRGYWGNAVAGNTLYKYTEGTNQKAVTSKMPYSFEFIAEEAGYYLVTVEFIEYKEGFSKMGGYTVLVKAAPGAETDLLRAMRGGETGLKNSAPKAPRVKAPELKKAVEPKTAIEPKTAVEPKKAAEPKKLPDVRKGGRSIKK